MSTTNDGGPAFPSEWAPKDGEFSQGMSLRDWFAGQALAGNADGWMGSDAMERRANWAYAVADSMLAERAKRTP